MLRSRYLFALLVASLCWFASCEKTDLAELDEAFTLRHRGADMPVYVHGDATDGVFLIVLHGGPGGNGQTYRVGDMREVVEREMAVVYWDQRGSGMAQGSYQRDELTIELMVSDVLALTDVLRHRYGADSRFVLMGHSWGGTLGSATLLEDQDRFLGWIEVDGAHDPAGIYAAATAYFLEVAAGQLTRGNNRDFWEEVRDRVSDIDTTRFDEDDLSYLNRTAFAAEAKLQEDEVTAALDGGVALDYLGTIFKDNPITRTWNLLHTNGIFFDGGLFETVTYLDRLPEITVPTLILWGQWDLVVPPAMAEEAFARIGAEDKELIIFERSGHSPMINENARFAEEVVRFVGRLR